MRARALVTIDWPVRAAVDTQHGPEGQLASSQVIVQLVEAEARGNCDVPFRF